MNRPISRIAAFFLLLSLFIDLVWKEGDWYIRICRLPCTCMVEIVLDPGWGDDLIESLHRLEKMGGEGKRVEYSSREDERQKEVDLVGQTC